GNMSPEYGSTLSVFPIDDVTLRYLALTGRSREQIALVEAYAKEQGLWHDPDATPRYTETLELDLSTVVPSIAGPKRPQDRIALAESPESFRNSLASLLSESARPLKGYDTSVAETFPASDPPSPEQPEKVSAAPNEYVDDAPSDTLEETAVAAEPDHAAISITLADGTKCEIDHGAVVIAAITSCTNTSNPEVMMAAALLAKNAVERGMQRKPWVKTSLAPGSRVVTDYYERADLMQYLEALGFGLVGYGCTTGIGNSGPLIPEVSQAVADSDLAAVSVLSGNRNFDGRIHSEVKMNYLMSPPLVVAYALTGTMDIDLFNDPLGNDRDGRPVYLKDIWPATSEVAAVIEASIASDM